MMDDILFLEDFKKGGAAQMQAVYDKYSPLIYGIILKKVPDEKVAEEVLICVFQVAFRNTHQFDPGNQRLFTWLYLTCHKLLHPANEGQPAKTTGYVLPEGLSFYQSQPVNQLYQFTGL